jgi:tetratricopeptide (TPR) repeat protein
VSSRSQRFLKAAGFAAAIFCAAAAFNGCALKRKQPVQRLAILRFENLGSDPDYDWLRRALVESIGAALNGDSAIYVIPPSRLRESERLLGPRPGGAPGISAERDLAAVAGASRFGYGEFAVRGGKFEVRLTIEDASTRKAVAEYSASVPASEPLSAALALAKQIWPQASARFGANPQAVRRYIEAMESPTPGEAETRARSAVDLDPSLGPAWRSLAQFRLFSGDRQGALDVIGQALRGSALPTLDRCRLEADAAELQANQSARIQALERIVQLTPSDPAVWQELGYSSFACHRYDRAATALEKALAVEPENVVALNQLGYARAYAGNLTGAEESLSRYQTLRPNEANPLDSLGDVKLIHGQLKEAEALYLRAAAKAPHFEQDGARFKAAMARLMQGDVPGAGELARAYLEARMSANDPAVEFRASEWLWAIGRRAEACTSLENFAKARENPPLRELGARAWAELAIWRLTLGDRPAAVAASRKAVAAAGPSSAAIAAFAAFLAQDPAPAAEWEARAGKAFAQSPAANPLRDFALAYALLLNKDFKAAVSLLDRIYAGGEHTDDDSISALLAWAYMETGRTSEAAALLRYNQPPSVAGTGPFLAFSFPRVYYLRGIAAARQGKPEQAAAQFQLFRTLSGRTPLLWGEENLAH